MTWLENDKALLDGSFSFYPIPDSTNNRVIATNNLSTIPEPTSMVGLACILGSGTHVTAKPQRVSYPAFEVRSVGGEVAFAAHQGMIPVDAPAHNWFNQDRNPTWLFFEIHILVLGHFRETNTSPGYQKTSWQRGPDIHASGQRQTRQNHSIS